MEGLFFRFFICYSPCMQVFTIIKCDNFLNFYLIVISNDKNIYLKIFFKSLKKINKFRNTILIVVSNDV